MKLRIKLSTSEDKKHLGHLSVNEKITLQWIFQRNSLWRYRM